MGDVQAAAVLTTARLRRRRQLEVLDLGVVEEARWRRCRLDHLPAAVDDRDRGLGVAIRRGTPVEELAEEEEEIRPGQGLLVPRRRRNGRCGCESPRRRSLPARESRFRRAAAERQARWI
jgi:hypothetical protein